MSPPDEPIDSVRAQARRLENETRLRQNPAWRYFDAALQARLLQTVTASETVHDLALCKTTALLLTSERLVWARRPDLMGPVESGVIAYADIDRVDSHEVVHGGRSSFRELSVLAGGGYHQFDFSASQSELAARMTSEIQRRARELRERPPSEPQPIASPPPDKEEAAPDKEEAAVPEPAPPAAVVDLNSAPEDELARLPGIGLVLAKRAVEVRSRRHGFASLQEFATALELKPQIIERLRPMVRLSAVPAPPVTGGRVVDY